MTDEYQSTRKEVLSEILNGVRSGVRSKFTKENASKVGKSLKDFGAYAVGTGGRMLAFLYIAPTVVRIIRDPKPDKPDSDSSPYYSSAEIIGGYTGTIGGIVADFGQVVGYTYAATEDHPEFLLIPVATNVASGVYEIGRKIYSDAKERFLEKHKPEGLEATVETAKPAQE